MTQWMENVRRKEVEASSYSRNIQTKAHIENSNIWLMSISDITVRDIQKVLDDKSKEMSRSSVNKIKFLLNIFYKYLCKEGLIEINPVVNTIVPSEKEVSVKKKTSKTLSEEDVKKIFTTVEKYATTNRCAEGWFYGDNAWLIVILLTTGLRIGELGALTWGDINFDKREITISKSLARKKREEGIGWDFYEKTPKTEAGERVIPLSERTEKALKNLSTYKGRRKSTRIMKRKDPSNVTRTLQSILKHSECSVQKMGLHGLRHTYASLLVAKGVPMEAVSYVLGHASISITQDVYIHLTKQVAAKRVMDLI